ncbi:MAG TPA: MFS transporter [Opitutaceae bacterium]|jgi:MFS family permease
MPNSTRRVLVASLAGTTIEFFDFYIYATAAVLVFPAQFFPRSDATAATLNSLATLALAFLARPIGSLIFGHFGDRLGRKVTLVTALLTMGLSTFAIGLLPTYAKIGVLAPLFLAFCRVGQGIGLGGEWGGAVLLATENAPPGKAAWYGMFPQLGAPLGYILSGGIFLILSAALTNEQFLSFGWRLPFLASSALVWIGLYVRLKLTETPAFTAAMEKSERVKFPIWDLCGRHLRALILGTLSAFSAFVIFYILSVFTLSWATSHLGYTRSGFLRMQLVGMIFFAGAIVWGSRWAESRGRRRVLIISNAGVLLFGLIFGPLFGAGTGGALGVLIIGFVLMGLNYGPLGTFLAELFPTAVRYTGASMTFNVAGILGASATPILAVTIAQHLGVAWVGYYLAASAAVTLAALMAVG